MLYFNGNDFKSSEEKYNRPLMISSGIRATGPLPQERSLPLSPTTYTQESWSKSGEKFAGELFNRWNKCAPKKMLAKKDIHQEKKTGDLPRAVELPKNEEMQVKKRNYCKKAYAKQWLTFAKCHPSRIYGLLIIHWLKSKLTKVINFKYEITRSAHAQNCKIWISRTNLKTSLKQERKNRNRKDYACSSLTNPVWMKMALEFMKFR